MPRAFGGIYTADKDPSLGMLLGQSTNNAAALIEDAKSGWGIEVTIEMLLRRWLGYLKDFTGIDLESLADLFANFFDNLSELFGDLNPFSGHFNPADAINHFVNMLLDVAVYFPLDLIQGIIGWFTNMGFQPVTDFLEQLITVLTGGLINEGTWTALEKWVGGLFNVIPVGSISSARPNLLPAPTFPVDSIATGGDWSIDPTSTRSADGSGSLMLVCDGHPHAIRSGRDRTDYVKVSPGQTLTASISVNTQDYVGTANWPIKLQIVPFHSATEVFPYTYEGDPVTVAQFAPLPGDMDWPGHMITDSDYVVPEGVYGVQLRLYVTSDAKGGILRFDDASLKLTGLIAQEQVSGLAGVIQGIISRIQVVVDAVVNAITGGETFLHTMEDLALALLNIPFGNIVGVGGPTNIGKSILAVINNILGGLLGIPPPDPDDPNATPPNIADIFNISKIVSSLASLGGYAWQILGIRNNTPVYTGMLPNGKSNFPIDGINTDLACSQSASLIATYRIGESSPLGVVSWLGFGSLNIVGFYCNIWKIDSTSGDWSLVQHSPNIVGNLVNDSKPRWHFWELDTPVATVAGEEYAFEFVSVADAGHPSAVHTIRGIDTTDKIPDHPFAKVVGLAATRNNTSPTSPPSTIAKLSVTRSGKVPWVEVAIDTGNAPGYYDPVEVYVTGNSSVPIPAWAGFVDCIAVGGGGGGREGGTLGIYGEGGHPGKFSTVTWERGVDFDSDTDTSVAFTCGAGGVGGSGFSMVGGAGTASTWALTGHTLTAAGGEGGDALRFTPGYHEPGQGAGSITFNDQPYVGGGPQYAFGAAGAAPGGGGCGGNWITLQAGGPGAPGAGWVRFRQGAIEGGGDIPDNTPPTPPTILLDEESFTTITVTATGSIDS